jgi:hypothetical protein
LTAVVILVPVDYLPIKKDAVSLSVDPILLFAVLGLAGFTVARRGRVWPMVLAVLVVATGAMVLLANSSTTARYYYLSFIVVGCMAFITAWRGSRAQKDLRLLSWVIVLAGGTAAALGVLEFVIKRNPIYGTYLPSQAVLQGRPKLPPGFIAPRSLASGGYRITSTIGHPLDVAALLSVVVLVSLGLAISADNPRERWIAFGVGALGFVAMVMTRSRALLILTPVAILLLVVVSRRSRPITGTTILIAIGVAAAIWLTRDIWLSRFTSQASASSTQARVLGLHYTESLLPSTIPFGLGFGAAQSRAGARGQTIGSASSEIGWGELLIDGGPLFALALLAIPVGGCISALRDRGRGDPMRLTYGVAALLLVIDGFSFNAVAVMPRSFLFVTMIAAGAAITDVSEADSTEMIGGRSMRPDRYASLGRAISRPRLRHVQRDRAAVGRLRRGTTLE